MHDRVIPPALFMPGVNFRLRARGMELGAFSASFQSGEKAGHLRQRESADLLEGALFHRDALREHDDIGQ
jgi:hypothetical protein